MRTSNIVKKVMPVPPVTLTATKIPLKKIVAMSIPPGIQKAMPVPPLMRMCPARLSPLPLQLKIPPDLALSPVTVPDPDRSAVPDPDRVRKANA
jgi:hypothetical protein